MCAAATRNTSGICSSPKVKKTRFLRRQRQHPEMLRDPEELEFPESRWGLEARVPVESWDRWDSRDPAIAAREVGWADLVCRRLVHQGVLGPALRQEWRLHPVPILAWDAAVRWVDLAWGW